MRLFCLNTSGNTKGEDQCQAILSGRQDVTYPPIIAGSVLQKSHNTLFEHYFLTTSRSRLAVGEIMSTRLEVAAVPDAPGAGSWARLSMAGNYHF